MNGSELGFEEWYEAEHPRLIRSLTVAAPSFDMAQECTDEAFSRAFSRWSRVSVMDNPTGWTYRVAVNVMRRRMRRRAMEERLLRRAQSDGTTESPIPDVDLWTAVKRLPERQLLAVALRYVAGMTEVQVADAMGVRPGTVAATLSAARGRLARLLADEPDDEVEVTVWQT